MAAKASLRAPVIPRAPPPLSWTGALLGGCKEEGQKRGMQERRGLKRNPAPLKKRPRVSPLVKDYVKCAGTERDEI